MIVWTVERNSTIQYICTWSIFTRSVFQPVILTMTHDVNDVKKMKSAADENGPKNATCKRTFKRMTYLLPPTFYLAKCHLQLVQVYNEVTWPI